MCPFDFGASYLKDVKAAAPAALMKIDSTRGHSPPLPSPPPATSLPFSPFTVAEDEKKKKKEGEKREEKKKRGIEVDPFVNKAASESNFSEKTQSQHEGGAVKTQVQADESGTGEALGGRSKIVEKGGRGELDFLFLPF